MQALIRTDDVYEIYELHAIQTEEESSVAPPFERPFTLPKEIGYLIEQYHHLFHNPTTFPSHWVIDHKIHLLPNTKSVNVRPYRYSHYQKREMEKLVAKMLDKGIIRFNKSHFSSPVLWVKKKYGSYQFVWIIGH